MCSNTAFLRYQSLTLAHSSVFMTFGHNRSQSLTENDDLVCVEVLLKLVRLKEEVISFAKQALLASQQMHDDYQ